MEELEMVSKKTKKNKSIKLKKEEDSKEAKPVSAENKNNVVIISRRRKNPVKYLVAMLFTMQENNNTMIVRARKGAIPKAIHLTHDFVEKYFPKATLKEDIGTDILPNGNTPISYLEIEVTA